MTTGAHGHTVRAPAHAPDGVAQGGVARGAAPHAAAAQDAVPPAVAQRAAAADAAPRRPAVIRQFELTEKVHAYDPKADTALIDAAYVLAMKAHGAQKRDNGDPYFTHPLEVADILAGYRLDTASIVTGLLHDVIEDTAGQRCEEIEPACSARRSPGWSTASPSCPGWSCNPTAPSRRRISASWCWR